MPMKRRRRSDLSEHVNKGGLIDDAVLEKSLERIEQDACPVDAAFISSGLTRKQFERYMSYETVQQKIESAQARCIASLVADVRSGGERAQHSRWLLESQFPSQFLIPNKSTRKIDDQPEEGE